MASLCGPPPPISTYQTFEEADRAVNEHAASNGYRLVVKQFKPSKANFTSCYYVCYKHRKPQQHRSTAETHPAKRRKTSTKMTHCPFSISIQRGDDGWAISEAKHSHNHGAAEDIMLKNDKLAFLFKYANDIENLAANSVPPQSIIDNLVQRDSLAKMINRHDIYNFLRKRRTEELAGHTRILDETLDTGVLDV